MQNLNLQHHVQLRDALAKKQIKLNDRMRILRSIDISGWSEISKEMVKIELRNVQLEVGNIQLDIDAQQAIIDDYMNNLE